MTSSTAAWPMRAAAAMALMALTACGAGDPKGYESISAYENAFPDAPYLYPDLGPGARIESLRALNLLPDGEPRQLELTISDEGVSGAELTVCLSQPGVQVIAGSLNACVFPVVLTVAGIEIRSDAARLESYDLVDPENWSILQPTSDG